MSEPKNTALDTNREMRYSPETMNTIRTSNLPGAVAKYLEAANRFDAAKAAACFTPDAKVCDEQKDYIGTEAIENWILDTSVKYRPCVTIRRAETKSETLLLSVEVSGDFPGSPVELNYEIRLRNDQIERLVIK